MYTKEQMLLQSIMENGNVLFQKKALFFKHWSKINTVIYKISLLFYFCY